MSDEHRAPYTFGEAVQRSNALDDRQKESEAETKRAYRALALAEETYRVELAKEITRLRAQSIAVTIASDLARGESRIARLKFNRDVAEGVAEAARQAAWRHQANRKDGHEFIDWSKRRDLAEGYHGAREPQQFETVNPRRAT